MGVSLSRAGMEVYKTKPVEEESKEKTDEPTTNDGTNTSKNTNDSKNTSKKDSKKNSKTTSKNNFDVDRAEKIVAELESKYGQDANSDSESSEEETTSDSSEDAANNFVLQTGEIERIDYVGEVFGDSYEIDYTDISSNASISVPIDYVNLFFKGKRCALKKGWQDDVLEWDKMDTALLGFVTELTWNNEKVDVKLSGMDKLLEKEEQFEFTQMKRSEVVKKIIEAAGLKAKVDPTGLVDDVIDFSNVSSSDEDDDGEGYTGEVSADIAKAAKQICQGKTSCLAKAKAIWRWCHDNMSYASYSDSQRGAEGCFKQRSGNCCDHAHVVVQMLRSVGIKAAYEHSTSCYSGQGHVWAIAYCDGSQYKIDASVKSCGFNEVGQGCSGTISSSINF